MDQNIKDLIDIAEEKNKIQAQYELTISSLKEEINRLKNTIKEQKILIETEKTRNSIKQEEIPSDIKILKDLILSQREELTQKEKDILFLQEQIEKQDSKFLDENNISTKAAYQQELFEANQEIMDLSIDIDNYQKQIETLKQIIEERETNETIDKLTKELNQIIKERDNSKTIIEDLEIHISYLQSELDKLNKEINNNSNNEVIDEILNDIEQERKINNEEIENYINKIENLQNDINEKDNQLNQLSNDYNNLQKDFENFKNQQQVNHEIIDLENDTVSKDIIKQLEQEIESLKNQILQNKPPTNLNNQDIIRSKHFDLENLPIYYQILFLDTLFANISESHKSAIIDSLIRNLWSSNSDIRRFAIKILRHIKTQKIFDVLKDFINDSEWLIRYYAIKALSEYTPVESLDKIMLEILKDNDADVRQLAKNYFIKNNS
ncbi:MAG: HEAT repeat domain-containing protein [Candidatus Lokiarchaeota archaeon]|nr:HEAT repeat domain-containing protein [Candidatus Lokiarchaeota archaeon]